MGAQVNYDIHLAVHLLVPDADYSNAYDYKILQETWEDVRLLPTEEELKAALVGWTDMRKINRQNAIDKIKTAAGLTDDELEALSL